MSEDDLRDCFAMFAITGLIMKGGVSDEICTIAYRLADEMLDARKKKEPDVGITAVKPKRRSKND